MSWLYFLPTVNKSNILDYSLLSPNSSQKPESDEMRVKEDLNNISDDPDCLPPFTQHFWPRILQELEDREIGESSDCTDDDDVSWEVAFRDSSRFWVQYVLFPIVVIVGVIGNAVTIYILTKKPMRSSTNV